MIDAHSINERVSLLTHQIYVNRVELDQQLISKAQHFIDDRILATGGTLGERKWDSLLRKPWDAVREEMLADTPKGRLLRSNSPF